ncbi:tetratricopeptide repeat protein [Arsenophonus nasoniae]|uniref:Type III secretion protein n=1 Tax=Arsenophonus nasoniae TaxID=638 RepID=A0AA95G9E6_9GAMM|nr:type III secretion protein [Arsenophonus nasoniae]WGL94407.1 type III secretion protein [Arsenophonus nasoniae]
MILDPITQNALLLQGWLALQYGQLTRSQILLEALLKMAPDDYQARKMLIVVLLKLDLPEQVLTHCVKLKNANINEAELWLCESQAYLMMEQQEKAQQVYQNYLLWKSN